MTVSMRKFKQYKIYKEAVKKSGMMMASDSIPDKMVISLAGKSALYKGDLMMLEMLAQCNWTRPLYVALTVGEENYMNLGDNFVQEGLVNRITPFTTNKPGAKNFDTEKAYHNIMTRFKFGNLKQKGLYIDETTMRMCYTHRRLLAHSLRHGVTSYRLDRMSNIRLTEESRTPCPELMGKALAEHASRLFQMFSVEETAVKLRFDRSLINVVVDRFGKDIILIPDGDDHFIFTVNVPV